MFRKRIDQLTPTQQALIPVYREKWCSIALSTEPVNQQKLTEAMKAVYAAIGQKKPEILFFDSPYAALETVISLSQLEHPPSNEPTLRRKVPHRLNWLGLEREEYREMRVGKFQPIQEVQEVEESIDVELTEVGRQFIRDSLIFPSSEEAITTFPLVFEESPTHAGIERALKDSLSNQLSKQLSSQLWEMLTEQLENRVERLTLSPLENLLWNTEESQLKARWLWGVPGNWMLPESWADWGSLFDFCISVLNCTHPQRKWTAYQLLVNNCGWIAPYEKVCIVCDRPRKLSFDQEYRLHAEGEPAIEYADGYSFDFYHGIALPDT